MWANLFTLNASFLSRWRASTANGMYMIMKARIVVQTATFSISFWPKLSNTVAKFIVLTGVTNPAPKPPSKLLRNCTFSGVADSTYIKRYWWNSMALAVYFNNGPYNKAGLEHCRPSTPRTLLFSHISVTFSPMKTFSVATPKTYRITGCNNQKEKRSKKVQTIIFRQLLLVASDGELQVTETPVWYLPIMKTGSVRPPSTTVPVHYRLDFKNSSKFFVYQQESAPVPFNLLTHNFHMCWRFLKFFQVKTKNIVAQFLTGHGVVWNLIYHPFLSGFDFICHCSRRSSTLHSDVTSYYIEII